MRSSMPRSCMCGSFMTSGALRTGAQGMRYSLVRAKISILPRVRVHRLDQRVGLVHMGDAAGIGRKTRVVAEILAAHRLQQILEMRLGDDVDRDMPVVGRERRCRAHC